MKRCLLLLAVLAVASGLSAQGNNKYTQEDVLAVFAQYNPAVLEEAKGNASYNEIVQALANSFQRVKTPENEAELLAVVKNFDNSLRLFLIAQAYEEGLALQQASNIDLASLDKTTQQDLLEVFQSIYNTTLQIRDEEIKLCKKRIKALKKDGSLTKEDKKAKIAEQKARIKELKSFKKSLKKDAKEQVRRASELYFEDLKEQITAKLTAEVFSAQQQELQAQSSDNLQIKTKNKKPVAK